MDIPLDLWFVILDYLDFISQLKLIQISKFFRINLYISDFSKISTKISSLLPEEFLSNKIKYLNICANNKIKNINNLTSLVKLNITCGRNINISNLPNLKILSIKSNLYITSLPNLNLTELNISGTSKIEKINHLTKLKKLSIINPAKFFDLSNLDLTHLFISGFISNFNHMTNLINLEIGPKNIFQDSPLNIFLFEININNFKNLQKLVCPFTNIRNISVINPTYLDISGTTISELSHITNLKYLFVRYNPNICYINNPNLLELNIGYTKINNLDLQKLEKLKSEFNTKLNKISCPNLLELETSGDSSLLDLNNLINLKKLTIKYSEIAESGIKNLNLTELVIYGVNHITSLKNLNNITQ